MICALFVPIDVKVFVEINNLVLNSKGQSDGTVTVAALATADFSTMKKDEKLYLCGHGDENTVGGRTTYIGPDVLAKDLLARKLPGHIRSIKLVTCQSGVGGAQAFCVRLREELRKQSGGAVDIPVIGITDLQTTNEAGQVRAMDQKKKGAPSYDDIRLKWGKQLTGWEDHAYKLPCATEEEIVSGATLIASMSKGLFAELYVHNAQTSLGKNESKMRA